MRPALDSIDDRCFDVAIIGAGINGAAAAQAAAASGYSVALLDKGDYGSGASSRSSRLLHCGLRYLAPGGPLSTFVRHPGRFLDVLKTVRRSMAARSDFVRTRPQSLRPIRMHYPVYRDGPYAPWQIDIAFGLLRALGDGKVPLDYERMSGEEARRKNPFAGWLRGQEQLRSIASYTEYQFDWPERVVLDMVFEAGRAGAFVRNYTAVTSMRHRDGEWRLGLGDVRSGEAAALRARVLFNLAGVWVDQVNALSGQPVSRRITGTKGAHIMFALPPQCRGHGLAGMARNGRPFYCMPWRDLHFVGPTETLYEGDPDDVYADAGDVAFILDEARHLFPGLNLRREDIVSTWAGIRPLTHDPALPMGNRSRRIHDLAEDGLPAAFALTNGSLGAHRTTGRDLLEILSRLVKPQASAAHASAAQAAEDRPVSGGAGGWRERLEQSAGQEHATSLEDVMARRMGLLWDTEHGLDKAEEIARLMAPALGWSEARAEREVAGYHDMVRHFYGVR